MVMTTAGAYAFAAAILTIAAVLAAVLTALIKRMSKWR